MTVFLNNGKNTKSCLWDIIFNQFYKKKTITKILWYSLFIIFFLMPKIYNIGIEQNHFFLSLLPQNAFHTIFIKYFVITISLI